MIVDKAHILKLAELANITLAEEEIDSYISDVNRILDLVSEIQDVDTTGVEPLSNVLDEFSETRDDTATLKVSREDALKNAPDTDGVYFQVPETLKHNKNKNEK
jgi:aspartyl-tRNA(Asn)/glutamyl-tRNA(Gln) amidotransferase subunit C|tara:strand:+ start:450 stop:761 length:312 start_codon:yes stop_codon:yes gene_type:complete